jgi:hypothetical protein
MFIEMVKQMHSKRYFLLLALLLPNSGYSQYVDTQTLEDKCISGSLENLASESDDLKATSMVQDLGFCLGYIASALDTFPLACSAAGQEYTSFDHEISLGDAREAFLEFIAINENRDELAVPVAQMAIMVKFGSPCSPY